jgi:hypothetical protein
MLDVNDTPDPIERIARTRTLCETTVFRATSRPGDHQPLNMPTTMRRGS